MLSQSDRRRLYSSSARLSCPSWSATIRLRLVSFCSSSTIWACLGADFGLEPRLGQSVVGLVDLDEDGAGGENLADLEAVADPHGPPAHFGDGRPLFAGPAGAVSRRGQPPRRLLRREHANAAGGGHRVVGKRLDGILDQQQIDQDAHGHDKNGQQNHLQPGVQSEHSSHESGPRRRNPSRDAHGGREPAGKRWPVRFARQFR